MQTLVYLRIFRKLAIVSAILALCVVVLGAYVRLSDAGLGCPDWPGCYGALTVPQSEMAIHKAQTIFPDKPIESHKAWKEMIHRYFAGTLGILILSLFIYSWRAARRIEVSPLLPTALLGIVFFQAMLGMWTVTLLLKPMVVSAHLLGGMTTLAILVWISHRHYGVISKRFVEDAMLRKFIRFALVIIYIQIFLGGWTSTNYAALACTDFPTCHGVLVPELDFSAFQLFRELGQTAGGHPLGMDAITTIQWTHRLGALVTFIYLGTLGVVLLRNSHLRSMATKLLFLLVLQVSLGISNLVLHLPIVLAVAHNFGAALLLVTIVIINSKITGLANRG